MNYTSAKKPPFSTLFRSFSDIIIFLSLLVFFSNQGFGSWKKVGQFPNTVNASFFFNEQKGFIGIDGANGIKRTSDGGLTWLDCIIPSGFTGYITDIFMKDSLKGWVTIEQDNLSHGLWSTTDGGITWQVNQSVVGEFSSIFQTAHGLILADRFGPNHLLLSIDGGLTFTHVSPDKYTGINFVDDLHGVATTYIGTAVYTNDGGLSWKPTSAITTEAWGVYAQKGTSTLIIAGERNVQDGSSNESVFASNDYGATWQEIGTLFGRTTGHVAGVGPVIYTQSWTKGQYPNSSGFVGMNRSTDGGLTWKNVGGPENYRDTRFSVMGCQGSVVYAFDENGGVWKTTDGGDGMINQGVQNPTLSSDHIDLTATSCSVISASFAYSDFSCNPIKIETISFSDSTLQIISSGALSFSRYPKLPQILAPLASDSLIFNWDPKKLGAQKLSKTFIRVHGSIINSSIIFDTLLAVSTESLPFQPDTHPDSIAFPAAKIGEQICSTFVLRNSAPKGNLPFILESAAFSNTDTTYRITSISSSLPVSVGAQDSVTLTVCFTPVDSSTHQDSLVLKTDCFNFAISLASKGVQPAGVRSSESANSLFIYPNPTQNELNINLQSEFGKKAQIEIFDALGKKVLGVERYLISGRNTVHIDTRNLSAGIYLIRIGESLMNFVKEK